MIAFVGLTDRFFIFPQAKRDPYRFRFPIEMRFVEPNIDHLMYVNFVRLTIFLFMGDACVTEIKHY